MAWATAKAFDAAGGPPARPEPLRRGEGPPGATRGAVAIAPQAASKRWPDGHTSRRALFLACRAIPTAPHLSMVRSPSQLRCLVPATLGGGCFPGQGSGCVLGPAGNIRGNFRRGKIAFDRRA